MSLALCFVFVWGLAACGGEQHECPPSVTTAEGETVSSLVTASETAAETAASEETAPAEVTSSEAETETVEPVIDVHANLVMAHDQMGERLVIYDLDAYTQSENPNMSLDDLEVWSIPTGHAAGLKYREGSGFGDVIVVAGNHSAIYAYPSGEELWGTDIPGDNPHSVELLPSGNLVIASSTGSTLRLFYTSQILEGRVGSASRYTDYTLAGAHGVLWDPTYQVLWAVGDYDLKAYRLEGEGKREALVEIPEMSIALPADRIWGHDLSPDYTDTRYLYITSSRVMRFDKETLTLEDSFPISDQPNRSGVKGFSNNPNGHFFITGETGGAGTTWPDWWKASWCTDGIYYVYTDGEGNSQWVKLTSTVSAFYKIRSFCGQYQ